MGQSKQKLHRVFPNIALRVFFFPCACSVLVVNHQFPLGIFDFPTHRSEWQCILVEKEKLSKLFYQLKQYFSKDSLDLFDKWHQWIYCNNRGVVIPPKSGRRRMSYPFSSLSTVDLATEIPDPVDALLERESYLKKRKEHKHFLGE